MMRTAKAVTFALEHLDSAPTCAYLSVTSPHEGLSTMRITSHRCAPNGRNLHDLGSVTYTPGMPMTTPGCAPGVLVVGCTGIQHDDLHEHAPGVTKTVDVFYAEVIAVPPSPPRRVLR
jgi:hypothetical protein